MTAAHGPHDDYHGSLDPAGIVQPHAYGPPPTITTDDLDAAARGTAALQLAMVDARSHEKAQADACAHVASMASRARVLAAEAQVVAREARLARDAARDVAIDAHCLLQRAYIALRTDSRNAGLCADIDAFIRRYQP